MDPNEPSLVLPEKQAHPPISQSSNTSASDPELKMENTDNWIYPIDVSTPPHLKIITEKTLYHNSLVILPSTFEKQFVAAVAMYNVYRWYPEGKIVFVSPRRQTLCDQRGACERIIRFSTSDACFDMMTRKPSDRVTDWKSKRVFFIGSGMLLHDMKRAEAAGMLAAMRAIKLLVIDEPQMEPAMTTRNIQQLLELTRCFRVLCCTTTFGKTVDPQNLRKWRIANLELQWNDASTEGNTTDSWMTNQKDISCLAVPLGATLGGLLNDLNELALRHTNRLRELGVLGMNRNGMDLIQVRNERVKYEETIIKGGIVNLAIHYEAMLNFIMAEKLLKGCEILKRSGISALQEHLQQEADAVLRADPQVVEFWQKIRAGSFRLPHTKFYALENFMKSFFADGTQKKAFVVAERLNSAYVINQLLLKIPGVKSRMICEGNYARDVEQFRNGELNLLVATVSVEPVLDLGETDLIVLFNMTDQPRRFLAHIARTRGNSPGSIVILTTRGLDDVAIADIVKTRQFFYHENRNILPVGVDLAAMMESGSPALVSCANGVYPQCREVFFNQVDVKRVTLDLDVLNSAADIEPNASQKRKSSELLV